MMNEQDLPHIVERAVPPGGFGNTLDAMNGFHAERGIAPMRRRWARRDDRDFVRRCFADREIAVEFAAKFGGRVLLTKTRLP